MNSKLKTSSVAALPSRSRAKLVPTARGKMDRQRASVSGARRGYKTAKDPKSRAPYGSLSRATNSKGRRPVEPEPPAEVQSINYNTHAKDGVKVKQLETQIADAEAELALLRKTKGEELRQHQQLRHAINHSMAQEKSKLKHVQGAVKAKREELSNALTFTKVADMENRIRQLEKEEPALVKQLAMLERIKTNQLSHIQQEAEKDDRDLEQVRAYKTQLADLNSLRRKNETKLQRLKAENVETEKGLHETRRGNEKLARAIKAVKDNPNLL